MSKKPEPRPADDPHASVEGKTFTWTTEDGDSLVIPLRVKVKTLRELNDVELDMDGMCRMVLAIAPEQSDLIDEMDANDFTKAFESWRDTYQLQAGASLGESGSSSS